MEKGTKGNWFKRRADKIKEWYYRDDNLLRVVRFPGTDLPFLDVVLDFIKLFSKGHTMDRASGVAFNFILALFPLILFTFTIIPYIPIPYLYERVLMTLNTFLLPSGTLDFVKSTIDNIMNQPHEGLLSLSILMSLVFGSSGIVAIFNGFHNIYARFIGERKTTILDWVKERAAAILMLIIIGILLIISIILISGGGSLIRFLVVNEILSKGRFAFFMFNVIRWTTVVFGLSIAVGLLYYFGNLKYDECYRKKRKHPAKDGREFRKFVIFSPGSIMTTALFILTGVGFNIYISNFAKYNALYGSIGTLIIVMMWIWIIAIVILAGNDLNSSIRRKKGRISEDEKSTRKTEIIIDDLKKHIEKFREDIEKRNKDIEKKIKNIQENQAIVKDLEEKNKDNEFIIDAYENFIKKEKEKHESMS